MFVGQRNVLTVIPYVLWVFCFANFLAIVSLLDKVLSALLVCDAVVGGLGADFEQALRGTNNAVRVAETKNMTR